MDHDHTHKQCPHGRCLNHDPEWENVGKKRLEPHLGWFGKKPYWFTKCCGKPMVKGKEVQTRQCKKCGRVEDCVTRDENNFLALCLCCGYHFIDWGLVPELER